VHFFLAMLLIGIALVHIAAAIDHHFLQRDATLTRMLRPRTFQHPHRGAP
jgi:cytochrome b561